jgi:hypothetical protein
MENEAKKSENVFEFKSPNGPDKDIMSVEDVQI